MRFATSLNQLAAASNLQLESNDLSHLTTTSILPPSSRAFRASRTVSFEPPLASSTVPTPTASLWTPRPSFRLSSPLSIEHRPASVDDITSSFRYIKVDTAAGLSGWTQPLLAIALKDEHFREFVLLYTRQVAQNEAPGREFMLATRMTVLEKKGGGIRPIAVPELLCRLMGKVLVRHYKKDDMLLMEQMGVGSKGGVEPMVRAIQTAADFDLPIDYAFLHTLDFSTPSTRPLDLTLPLPSGDMDPSSARPLARG